jgi:hypothetical protein
MNFNFLLHPVYSKKVQAATHCPTKSIDLSQCNYIGLKIPVKAIYGHQDSFEFVLTFENSSEIITFAANTW